MLYLITGVPGASKTLNTIKMLVEDEDFNKRSIYYHNIKEVTFDWTELSTDDAKKWYELPPGSIILFDEAQELFPACKPSLKDQVPEMISMLNKSRHQGFDLFFVTQHPALLDVRLRRLCAPHIHYDRAFGSRLVTKYLFKKCAADPDDYHAKKDSSRSSIKIDKKYYGTYKSTEIDTHKFKPPKKLYLIILLTLFFLAYLFYFISSFGEPVGTNTTTSVNSILPNNLAPTVSGNGSYPLDPDQYLKMFIPRINGMAHTAPIYDKLNVPVAMPKTLCVRKMLNGKRDCKCFTQQASRLVVDEAVCNSMIDNRYFDYTIPDDNGQMTYREQHQPITEF